jgi:ATP-dependent DNA ligase
LPERLQPMLATLTDAPFDDNGWIFEDKYDGFRTIVKVEGGKVSLYSRNGKIVSRNYMEVAKALEGVKGDAVIDGDLSRSARTVSPIFSCCRTRSVMRQSCNTAHSISCFKMEKICGLAAPGAEGTPQIHPAQVQADRLQPSPQSIRDEILP